MAFQDLPIKGKIRAVIMLTSVAVLLFTAAAFMVYDLVTYRQTMLRNLSTTASIIADNSTAALAFKNETDAQQVLAALHADPHVVEAALYDDQGNLYVRYPTNQPAAGYPVAPEKDGERFGRGSLNIFAPITEGGSRLGTLYLKSDLRAFYTRTKLYGGIAFLVLLGSLLVALAVSSSLQKRISDPILALTATAKLISEQRDYGVRAEKMSGDEIGLLTDAFNQMLTRIQEQTLAAQQSGEQLRLSLEASGTGTWDWNLKTNKVLWDQYNQILHGFKPGTFNGDYNQSITAIHAEDRPAVAQAIAQTLQNKTEFNAEFRVTWPDGSVHYLVSRGKALFEDGQAVRMTGVTADITGRREAEEVRSFLVAIVQSSDDAIIGKDLQSNIVSWNVGAEKMFGYTAGEMLGQPVARLLSPDRPDEESRILREAIQGATHRFETVRLRKGGQPIDVSLTVSPIHGARGAIIGISSIARDITERKRTEEQIRQMNVALEQRVQDRTAELTAANREMEAFTYSVAHDLRAPLRHIDAFTRILHEDFAEVLPAEARRYLDNIRHGSRNMSHLVDDLLNLARIGRQGLKRQPIALGALVKEVIADLNRDTEGRQIEWRIQPLPTVECDSGLLKQVYANLLGNAVKYSRPRAKAVIEIGSRKVNGDTALFVSDNGVGFNMKYADKLFGVFQRLHRSEDFEGTGVGLATVDRIVRKHGGSIWAEAVENKGATFYFTMAGLGTARQEPPAQAAA
jgi:PAS domain S-box-containing protein